MNRLEIQCIIIKYVILYIPIIIIVIFGILELGQLSKFDPIGQKLDRQPLTQISLQDKCDQDQETISYHIQSTVIGCYCQGNKRYSCTELQIKNQGCIPIQSSTGIYLSSVPIFPKSKQYIGKKLCANVYKGLNQRQQIEKNILLEQDCHGDYKICGNETAFFCIHKNESSCPIGSFIFSNTALQKSNFVLVNNISNIYFLYVEKNQTQYIGDIQLIDGQGVCQDKSQISLLENKTSYELDQNPATICPLDQTYEKYTEIIYQIFQNVNNFSYSEYFKKTRPFYDEEQSNIKMFVQKLSYVNIQCRHEIHNYLKNKDITIIKFNILLCSQLVVLIFPMVQLIKNQKIRFIYVSVTYALFLGIGTWQIYSLYDYLRILNSLSFSCQFNNKEDVMNQSIVYQLILISITFVLLIISYILNRAQNPQNSQNPQNPLNIQIGQDIQLQEIQPLNNQNQNAPQNQQFQQRQQNQNPIQHQQQQEQQQGNNQLQRNFQEQNQNEQQHQNQKKNQEIKQDTNSAYNEFLASQNSQTFRDNKSEEIKV